MVVGAATAWRVLRRDEGGERCGPKSQGERNAETDRRRRKRQFAGRREHHRRAGRDTQGRPKDSREAQDGVRRRPRAISR